MKYTKLLSIIFGFMLSSTILVESAFGQISPFSTVQPSDQPQKKIGVKIISPVEGQKIRLGKPITINGISTDNSTLDCQVSVIVNNMRPYQNAGATGSGSHSDYSTWTFRLMPNYTTLNEGQNKITSKILCSSVPTVSTKWYSVNVTGTVG